jgi:hypothetical protein
MRIVVLESPYKADSEFGLQRNLAYASALVEHVTLRGDSPVASHLLITQSLDDRILEHRKMGIAAGLAILRVADVHAFGVDLGMSAGMEMAMDIARNSGKPGPAYEEISLPEWNDAWVALCDDIKPMQKLIDRYAPKWHVHEKR